MKESYREVISGQYLLDTHVMIWWMTKSKRLSSSNYEIINDPQNHIIISVVSIWEMLIKQSKNKLKVPKDIISRADKHGFEILPIGISHVLCIESLPKVHNDPFDRMIVSQAKMEGLTIISSNKKFVNYNIPLITV